MDTATSSLGGDGLFRDEGTTESLFPDFRDGGECNDEANDI